MVVPTLSGSSLDFRSILIPEWFKIKVKKIKLTNKQKKTYVKIYKYKKGTDFYL